MNIAEKLAGLSGDEYMDALTREVEAALVGATDEADAARRLTAAGLEERDAATFAAHWADTWQSDLREGSGPVAMSATAMPPPPDPTDRLVRGHGAALAQAYRGAMAPFRAAILSSTSREDCLATLKTLYADWPAERLAEELNRALQLAAAEGAAGAGAK